VDTSMWRALVNAATNLRILSNAGKLSEGYKTEGISTSVC
jgi:hypothetical protein